MGTILTRRWLAGLAATWTAASVCAQSDRSDRNEFYLGASAGYIFASTDLNTWTEGGFSKLRYTDDGFNALCKATVLASATSTSGTQPRS